MNNTLITIIVVVILYYIIKSTYNTPNKSNFNNTISGDSININTPYKFNDLDNKFINNDVNDPLLYIGKNINNGSANKEQQINLVKADVPEEGAYPIYGSGASMDRNDSNVLLSDTEVGPLHLEFKNNESIGESPYTDKNGSRIVKIKSTGNQTLFKGIDENEKNHYLATDNLNEISSGNYLLKNEKNIDYSSDYLPTENIKLESSPGYYTNSDICENTYPRNIKNKNTCILEGDIPYGEIVNGKVNPRLLSRYEYLTGDYDPYSKINKTGNLYPVL
jgi:hypothetical protein